jgi:hypothetical protein
VCFVTNNSFCVDPIPFDGMRKEFERQFTSIYHIDLHGNVRKNPKLSGTSHNVFGIQTGVGITVAVRKRSQTAKKIEYHRVPTSTTISFSDTTGSSNQGIALDDVQVNAAVPEPATLSIGAWVLSAVRLLPIDASGKRPSSQCQLVKGGFGCPFLLRCAMTAGLSLA